AVQHHLPADAGRSQCGGLPVVLLEADIVLRSLDAKGSEGFEIEILYVRRGRLENHLELIVLVDPEGVLGIATVDWTSRRRAIGDAPRLGAQDAEEGVGGHRPGAPLQIVGLLGNSSPSSPVL